jgi:hypothetical protein
MQKQKKHIVLKLNAMETRVFEAVWVHLSPLGKQLVTTSLSRLRELAMVDEREKVLRIMRFIMIGDNPQLENADCLTEFFEAIQAMSRFQIAQLLTIDAILLNLPIGSFSVSSTGSDSSTVTTQE